MSTMLPTPMTISFRIEKLYRNRSTEQSHKVWILLHIQSRDIVFYKGVNKEEIQWHLHSTKPQFPIYNMNSKQAIHQPKNKQCSTRTKSPNIMTRSMQYWK